MTLNNAPNMVHAQVAYLSKRLSCTRTQVGSYQPPMLVLTTNCVSISCALDTELNKMAVKPSFSNYYRSCILKEMVARGL
jgi:hypothetical protein